MASFERVLDSLTEMDRYLGLMSAAAGTAQIAAIASAYLQSWSGARILELQRIDAGWAPFDDRQQPVPICEAADVLRIAGAVHDQCVALRASGIQATPELLELDLFFFFARQIVEDRETAAVESRLALLQHSQARQGRRAAESRAAGAGH